MKPTTSLLRATSAAALLSIALAGCGGGGSASSVLTGPGAPNVGEGLPPVGDGPVAVSQGALRPASTGEIATYFRARIERLGLDGLQSAAVPAAATPVSTPVAAAAAPDTGGFAAAPLQEAGVDEEDLIKGQGSAIYSVHAARWVNGTRTAARLAAHQVHADGTLAAVGAVTLPDDQSPQGMYLAPESRRLALLAQRTQSVSILPMPMPTPTSMPLATSLPYSPVTLTPPAVSLHLYGTDNGVPAAQRRIDFDGRLVGSRRIGNTLYVVSTWTPSLSGVLPATAQTTEQVRAALASLDSAALLPRMRVDGGAYEPLVQEPSCLLQSDNASMALQLTTISAFDLSSPDVRPSSRCFVGDSSALYMSAQNLYLATSRQAWIAATSAQTVFPEQTSTDVHKFALDAGRIDYRGSGQVRGHLGWDPDKVAQRMSEHDGHLRVVTFTGQTGRSTISTAPAPSPASLTVLREDAASRSLVAVSTLPNSTRPAPIGHPGEQVYAVHFAGPQAYVVTFRRTDPLYVLDLGTPTDPKVAGELSMPGYSDYLYPLANGRLLGVGRDASLEGVVAGIKLALFDVRDAQQPRLLAQRVLGGGGSYSALDESRRGISILTSGSNTRIALPVRLATMDGRPGVHGLARLSADLTAGTLTEHALVQSPAASSLLFGALGAERALQTAQGSYYLTGEHLLYTPAP